MTIENHYFDQQSFENDVEKLMKSIKITFLEYAVKNPDITVEEARELTMFPEVSLELFRRVDLINPNNLEALREAYGKLGVYDGEIEAQKVKDFLANRPQETNL